MSQKRSFNRSGNDRNGFRGFKSGRKELRQIKKARKPSKNEEIVVDQNLADEFSSESENEAREDIESGNDAADSGEVYSALLTLLKHENRGQVGKKNGDETGTGEDRDVEVEPTGSGDQLIEEGLVPDDTSDLDDGEEQESEVEDSEDEEDPFQSHFNAVSEREADSLQAGFDAGSLKTFSTKNTEDNGQESFIFTQPCVEPNKCHTPSGKQSLSSYFIKNRLKVQNDLLDSSKDPLTSLQRKLVDPIFQYRDLLYEYANYDNEDEYRDLYTLHLLNHVYKTRDRILKDNQRLQDNNEQELLDQGFTRPKVLLVLPTRDVCHKVVTKIIEKSGVAQVDKKGKFQDQFNARAEPPTHKPKSFQHIFSGNTDDFFVLGMKFTRKAIKLYSNFYQSDVIVCSPLGIQLILENTDKKKRQDDFLSSVELMIYDQFHSIEFQNVQHVTSIFAHINKIPQQQHDADFSRIRMWYINDQAKQFRQTLIFTKYASPFANSLINGRCRNHAGRWKNRRTIGAEESAVSQVGLRVRQIFQRFDLVNKSVSEEPDARFKFFTSVIIPNMVKSTGYEDGFLLYIPDYTDYVRVRNYLHERTTLLFGDVNEYSSQRRLTSRRSLFQQGRLKVLLYTERLHHFRRYDIKGVKNVIFYKPPSNPEFYQEVVRFIGRSAFHGVADLNISVVRCLFSKLDSLALEKIVGSQRAAVLTHGQNEVYEFK
ncbi:LAMI_0E03796g1_1 [Lachancea mirantina]|uniref:U3 small nucleolar RNA-associated protein 25 n=1 Tax=Lachancea mirantina TaxID=1230905 RepID=A0A1G4JK64_9SACH|nr:LAMI_0E03796g1_1 [Lachancea mirantina]